MRKTYTPGAMEYIESVDGAAHQSAVDIISALEQENKALRKTIKKLNVSYITITPEEKK